MLCGHELIAPAHTRAHTYFHAKHPHSCIQGDEGEEDASAKEHADLPHALPSSDAAASEQLKDDEDERQSPPQVERMVIIHTHMHTYIYTYKYIHRYIPNYIYMYINMKEYICINMYRYSFIYI